MGKQLIIALGREVGTGGREIAELLAKHYDIPLLDKNILEHIADEKDVDATRLKELDKYYVPPMLKKTVRGMSSSAHDNMFLLQFEYLQKKAKAGESFVIVGRCAEYVLKEYDSMVSIFICGDKETRKNRIMEKFDKTELAAEHMMLRKDTERRRYHNRFAEGKWGDSRTYDICVDSGVLGMEGTAEVLIDFIDKKHNI